jgi:large subunit ribosomal protein L25
VSTDRPTLAALPRTELGKATAHLRKAGRIPAVVFGHGESTSVSVDAHEFELLRRRAGANALIDLEVAGGQTTPVVINGVQLHRVHRTPLHVDLFRVNLAEDMTVDVMVHSFGESEAVTKEGGTLIHAVDHVRVRARPDRLPKFIEVDVSTLADFDSVIAVRDLPVPAGAAILNDQDEVIFRVLAPRVVEVEPEAVAEVAPVAEPAEGEAPAE